MSMADITMQIALVTRIVVVAAAADYTVADYTAADYTVADYSVVAAAEL